MCCNYSYYIEKLIYIIDNKCSSIIVIESQRNNEINVTSCHIVRWRWSQAKAQLTQRYLRICLDAGHLNHAVKIRDETPGYYMNALPAQLSPNFFLRMILGSESTSNESTSNVYVLFFRFFLSHSVFQLASANVQFNR